MGVKGHSGGNCGFFNTPSASSFIVEDDRAVADDDDDDDDDEDVVREMARWMAPDFPVGENPIATEIGLAASNASSWERILLFVVRIQSTLPIQIFDDIIVA